MNRFNFQTSDSSDFKDQEAAKQKARAFLLSRIEFFTTIVREGRAEINKHKEQLTRSKDRLMKQKQLLKDSKSFVNGVNALISMKAEATGMVSWISAIIEVAHELVSELGDYLPDEVIEFIDGILPYLEDILDIVPSALSEEPILGVSLVPDPRQISEAKGKIADVLNRVEKLKLQNQTEQ